MKLRAPAKVNLSLQILGRRPDGYHDIDTLMTTISLADELEIDTRLGHQIRTLSDDTSLPTGADNLASRAAHAFYSHTGLRYETTITIRKRIPHGAGLGGGSSDAATVLLALNTTFETHLTDTVLETLGARIGSDVPFFIRRQPARARGRGEILEPVKLAGTPLHLVLIKPPFAVPTPWAYHHWAGSIPIPGAPIAPQTAAGLTFVNDLERPVFEKFLLLPVIKRWLLDQPETRAALMSGSGSTLFALCPSAQTADALAARAREEFSSDYWIQTCQAPAGKPKTMEA